MSVSNPEREQRTRELAYELWERDGRPDGRSNHYWAQAWTQTEAIATAANPPTIPMEAIAPMMVPVQPPDVPKKVGKRSQAAHIAPKRTNKPQPKA